ncbi:thioredoxin-like protein [Gongronella butleri]|nr:thioredoxin-like protein [Gongronella butleri]
MSRQRDLEDLSDDDALFEELEKDDDLVMASIREQRLKEIQEEFSRRETIQTHGSLAEIDNEKELMDTTVKEKYMVAHFYHPDFRRCKIMDKHLAELARDYKDTRFVKISVDNAPFLVEKLQVRVLPCVIGWVDGYIKTKIVGFDELGNTDDFSTNRLAMQFISAGVIRRKDSTATHVKKSIFQSGGGDSDEDDD